MTGFWHAWLSLSGFAYVMCTIMATVLLAAEIACQILKVYAILHSYIIINYAASLYI